MYNYKNANHSLSYRFNLRGLFQARASAVTPLPAAFPVPCLCPVVTLAPPCVDSLAPPPARLGVYIFQNTGEGG